MRGVVIAFLTLLVATPVALAQEPKPDETKAEETKAEAGKPGAEARPAPPAMAPDSPRASLLAYLVLCREGKYDQAAQYLELPADKLSDGPRLAKRLKVVLDNHIWFDLDKISPLAEGDRDDKLPENLEELGTIPASGGKTEPVRMTRIEGPAGAHWAFAAGTVGRVDAWYSQLGGTWLREYLPDAFFRPGPRDLLWWQWAALPILLIVSYLVSIPLAGGTRWVLARLFARTETTIDDAILARVGGPLRFAWVLLLLYIVVPGLHLYAPAQKFIFTLLKAGAFIVIFWSIMRSADIIGEVILKSPWAVNKPQARPLLSLAVRAGKVAIFVIGIIGVLSEMGYPVASLVAGLGIGGLAFALAAQRTVENVFGSVSIGMDQPMREGEFVRVEDFVGTVEAIGLRSTRFRTLDRTLITIPNGKLADMRIETFAARDRCRFATTIGLVYGTTEPQMRTILDGIEKTLRAHPKCWQDAVTVRFKEFGPSSLDVEISVWFTTADYAEFTRIKQDMMLEIMKVVQGAGSDFAFPTQTVHLAKPSA
jgi:MscS family membrane protein